MYSKESLKRFSGWTFILGSIAFHPWWILLILEEAGYIHFNTVTSPVNDTLFRLMSLGGFLVGPILFTIALFALRAGYHEKASPFGRFVLLIGGISGVTGMASALGMQGGSDIFFTIYFFSIVILFFSLALFGIPALRHKLLPRLNGLPLAGIFWFPMTALLLGEYQPSFGAAALNVAITAGYVVLAIALILIGAQILVDIPRQKTAS